MRINLSIDKDLLELLYKKCDRQPLSAMEQALLDQWLAASPDNQEVLANIEKGDWIVPGLKGWERKNAEAIWERSRNQAPVKPMPGIQRRYRWWSWAAAALLVLSTGIYLWSSRQQSVGPVVLNDQRSATTIKPGQSGAILTLADGQQIVLDSIQNRIIASQHGASVVIRNGQLTYDPTGNNTGEIAYNVMSTPKGRQFNMTLPDGTQVWLNAASSIRFPTLFAGNERSVEITGEAYFEVARNTRMPFRVIVDKRAKIEVLGTQFNVNAYANERTMKTTLLEGSVKLSTNEAEMVLKPGQQAQSAATIKVVDDIDVDAVMAWKSGLFNFNGARLEEVMNQLERWYDIEVEYEKGIPDIHFGGGMSKNIQLSDMLTILEKSKVHFRVEGRKLIVLP